MNFLNKTNNVDRFLVRFVMKLHNLCLDRACFDAAQKFQVQAQVLNVGMCPLKCTNCTNSFNTFMRELLKGVFKCFHFSLGMLQLVVLHSIFWWDSC